MRPQRRIVLFLIVILLVLAAGAWYLGLPSSIFRPETGKLKASGAIEADRVAVTAEVGGTIVEILANEGDTVAANAVVARLDSESALADLTRARAALAEAQARRDLTANGARPEDKAQADAALQQAIAARDGARRAADNALSILNNPQELDARIDTARTQLDVAAQQIDAARAQKSQAEAARDRYRGDGSDLGKTMYSSFDLQSQAAQESIAAALAQRDGAQAALSALLAIRANPLELQGQVHQAEARWHESEASTQMAQAARDLVYAGATSQDLAMAEAGVLQAQAAVNVAEARVDKLVLRSPAAGRVSQKTIELGQVVAPGVSAFTIVNDDRVTLTVYLPEDRIGKVRVGQAAGVSVDSLSRGFTGLVTFISSQAEFTPKNVQTVEGRVSQVFAVKIRIDNSEHALKPGMPADAFIAP